MTFYLHNVFKRNSIGMVNLSVKIWKGVGKNKKLVHIYQCLCFFPLLLGGIKGGGGIASAASFL